MSEENERNGSACQDKTHDRPLDFIFEYTKEAPGLQLEDSDKLDTKMYQIFAAATVAIGLAARLSNDETDRVGPVYLFGTGPVDLFVYLAAAAYIILVVVVIVHLLTKKHRRSLQAHQLWEEHKSTDVDELKRMLAEDISEAHKHNTDVLVRKSKTVNLAVWATGAEGLFITAALIFSR